MATITTDTFLDDGTARTSNESWTLSVGAVLKVRTDTRWHVGAPASMTGTIGNVNCNSTTGGGYYIDGTKVRWMAYDTGSGNVPAIGTSITQGGVSGYLLGVWADYTSAPTAVGATMPTSGFIKFREVTGGQFAVGALTGIGANATEADRVGWIEVVHNISTAISIYNYGLGFKSEGDWFDLGITSGSAGQIIQFPTNGGGAATEVNGVQIETSPGSGVYEWWPALSTAVASAGWRTNSLGTDLRGKAVQYVSNGQLRIGSDGTSNIGYVPAAGCKIRSPNIFLRLASANGTNVAQNTSIATNNVRILSSAGGSVDISKTMSNWAHTHTALNNLSIKDTSIQHHFVLTNILAPLAFENLCFSHIANASISNSWNHCGQGGTITNFVCSIQEINSVPFTISVTTKNLIINNLKIIKANQRTSSVQSLSCTGQRIEFNNLTCIGGYPIFNLGSSATITNYDYCDRSVGETTSSGSSNAILFTGGPYILNGVTFGLNGSIANQHPYSEIIGIGGNIFGLEIKNIGSYSSPLNTGSNSTYRPNRLLASAGQYESNVSVKRVFIGPTRNSFIVNLNSAGVSEGFTVQNSGVIPQTGYYLPDMNGRDVVFKGCYLTTGTNGTSNNMFGSFFHDFFTSTTVGRLQIFCINPSALTTQYITYGDGASFDAAGKVILPTTSSYAIFESPYVIKGHTGFSSGLSLDVVASGNYSAQYQIDTGSGWNGTWKTVNGTNLSAESINPTTGFKIKVKFQGTDTNASRYVWKFGIPTVTTSTAQSENLYPLSTATLAFTGLQAGSEVRCYSGTDPNTSVEIGGIESTSGSTFSFSHSAGGEAGYIMIFALGYQPLYIPYTFKTTNDSLLIQQVIDRNYTNPV